MQKYQRWIAVCGLLTLIMLGVALRSQAVAAGKAVFLPIIGGGFPIPLPTATTEPGTPTAEPSPTTPPVVPPADAASARLKVPAGFAVRLFATGLESPRLMTVGPDGFLYVAERSGNQITRLADRNGDGLADANEVVASDLSGPHNVEWHDGSLYVAENDKITKLTDANGDGDFLDANEKTTITTNIPSGGGHSSRTLHFGPDGTLYVAAGSSSNNSVETDKRRATIMRFNLDGSIPTDNPFASDADANRQPVWAEGLRNSVDFLFMPNGQLWADHNGSDGLGDNVPPEKIVINVEKGKHYGWPFCYTPAQGAVPAGTQDVRDERVPFAPPISDCGQSTPALFTDLAHEAPLGMARYDKTQFPAAYQANLFVAYHGSWNSSVARDCKVQMITVQNDLPTASTSFLTGFRDNESQRCDSAWGRPAGVAVGADGALYVSDDKNGNVYRIVYTGAS